MICLPLAWCQVGHGVAGEKSRSNEACAISSPKQHPVACMAEMKSVGCFQFAFQHAGVVMALLEQVRVRRRLAGRGFPHKRLQSARPPCHHPGHGAKKSGALPTLPADSNVSNAVALTKFKHVSGKSYPVQKPSWAHSDGRIAEPVS